MRCLNAFSSDASIVNYFVTLLAIIFSEQRDSLPSLSPLATQITPVLLPTLLLTLIAIARQYADEYTRVLFLFLFGLIAKGGLCSPL